MPITRRAFLTRSGYSLAAVALVPSPSPTAPRTELQEAPNLRDWSAVRDQFDLSKDSIHLATFYLASHPRPVREAIERYRREIDKNPFLFVEHHMFRADNNYALRVMAAAAEYIGGKPDEIAITNSTTMGLALIYSGLPFKKGQEILTTDHDHYVHHESIRFAAAKTGASIRKISLFDSFDSISEDSIVNRIRDAIRPHTRAVGITWVHSSTGLKLPLRAIAAAVRQANANRNETDRVLLIVDGVHGFGVEDEIIATTGVDFFAAGTHKWILGPRGTGIIWAPGSNWALIQPTIPSFYSEEVFVGWMRGDPPQKPTQAAWVSPGGFHAFEHEWAVADAFEFLKRIGRKRIAERIHSLNARCKEGLAGMKRIRLYTPRSPGLSSGLVCFDVNGMKAEEVVARLLQRKIVASTTPYATSYARLAPSIINTPEEIEKTLQEIGSMT